MEPFGPLRLLDSITDCVFLKKKEPASLHAAGIETVHDLLMRIPRRYEDRRRFDGFDSLGDNRAVCLRVRVVGTEWRRFKGYSGYFQAVVEDMGSLLQSRLNCRWFQFPGISKMICTGQELIIYGRPQMYGKSLCMVHPDFEIIHDEEDSIHLERIVPVYGSLTGISSRRYREIVWQVLQELDKSTDHGIYEFAPRQNRVEALTDLHFPESMEVQQKARRRFALEECFVQQLNVLWRRQRVQQRKGIVTAKTVYLIKDLADSLPFELTDAQKRCVNEMVRDMKSGHQMNRLLQGDVGSGKTLVALCAMLTAVEAGWQAVMMAPTQILAEQHYKNFRRLLDPLGVNVSLRTGDRREESHLDFASAKQAGVIIGTHALLHAKNAPENPGLVVIDEQHKFGVGQREKLISHGDNPDILVMTATPIPRTLTLTLYGDLDVSIIDELPKGRNKIITAIRSSKDLKKVVKFVKEQIEEGRQIYIVSPLIEGSESRSKTKSVLKDLEEWQKRLPDVDIALLHGKMSPEEKDMVMRDFQLNKISVLVATTVIEVGVDVPNATVMIVNNPESFGLSQLHQLRGRIGRGTHRSYCIMLTDIKEEDEQWEKLKVIEQTSNGFTLAEEDLRLRGPGDVLGTAQSGLRHTRFDEWLTDIRLIHRGRELAEQVLGEDPELSSDRYRLLRTYINSSSDTRAITS